MNNMSESLLTPSQIRALHSSLLIFEKALRNANRLLLEGEESGVFYYRKSKISSQTRDSIQRIIQSTLIELEEFAKMIGLKPLAESLESNIMGEMSISWESLEESRSKRMKGYGELDPRVKEVIDPAINHFAKIALDLCNLTMPGPEAEEDEK